MVLLNAYNCKLFEASNTNCCIQGEVLWSVLQTAQALKQISVNFLLLKLCKNWFNAVCSNLVLCAILVIPFFCLIWCKGDWKQLICWVKMTVNYFFYVGCSLISVTKKNTTGFRYFVIWDNVRTNTLQIKVT